MNLTLQHLEHPSPRFVAARASSEARLGCKLVKYFCDTPATGQVEPLYDDERIDEAVDGWAKRHRIGKVAADEVHIALERVRDIYVARIAALQAKLDKLEDKDSDDE